MGLKKKFNSLIKLLAGAAAFAGIYFFCESQTRGFRLYQILSNLPDDPRWEAPPLSQEKQKQIDSLLSQPFKFLGSGGWCIAFLGEDQKTVLKFYKHNHLHPSKIWKEFSFDKLRLSCTRLPQGVPYFQEFNFKSCTFLYKEARERTGLLYIHLNKTKGLHKPVTLIDNIGIRHTVDLDKTEFVIQKRADLLLPHLDRLAKQNKIQEAKRCIDDMLDCLLTLYKLGARDYDHSLSSNFGYTDEGAVTFDLSSFAPDASLKKPGEYRKELIVKSRSLSRFLEKNHKDLSIYFESRLSQIAEKG
jgi:hypothetical protein